MCLNVFIASEIELKTERFIPNETLLFLEKPSKEEFDGVKIKFKNKYIYLVGSDTNCSCGFSYSPYNSNDQEDKDSPFKLLEFIKEQTQSRDLEYFSCWEGEWEGEPEISEEIDIRTISLENNYFVREERHYIKFLKQKDQQ